MGSSELSFDRGLDPKQPWFRAAGPEIKQEGGSELTFHFNSAADPDYVSAEVYWFGTLHSEWEKDAGGGELNLESWAGIVAIDEDGTRTDKVDLKYTDVQGSGKTAKSFSFFRVRQRGWLNISDPEFESHARHLQLGTWRGNWF